MLRAGSVRIVLAFRLNFLCAILCLPASPGTYDGSYVLDRKYLQRRNLS
jgi:hypothetical protein